LADFNVYLIDIDTKEQVAQYTYSTSVNTSSVGYGLYDIDYEALILANDGYYGVIAVNNGYVHPSYEYSDSVYMTTYEASDNVYFGDEVMDSWILYVTKNRPPEIDRGQYREAILTDDAVEARLKFGDTPYGTTAVVEADEENEIDFVSITISEGLMSDSFFSYGSAYSPTCSVVMTKCNYAVPNVWFRVEYKVDGVWQCFGCFYINSVPQKRSDEISFSGVGILEVIMQNTAIGYIGIKVKTFIARLFQDTGIPLYIEFLSELENQTQYWDNLWVPFIRSSVATESGTTEDDILALGKNYREALVNFAIALHSNVVERNGVIRIVHTARGEPKAAMRFLFDGTQYTDEPSDMGYYYYPSPIDVKADSVAGWNDQGTPRYVSDITYAGNATNYQITNCNYESGEEVYVKYQVVISSDPMKYFCVDMLWGGAEETTTNYAQMMKNIGFYNDVPVYKPFSVEFMGYNPMIFPGSIVAVDNGDIIDYNTLIGNITITYDGSISMAVDTPCDVQMQGENSSQTGSNSASSSAVASAVGDISVLQNQTTQNTNNITQMGASISAINSTLNGKQNQLVAGTNITLVQNADGTVTINSTGGSGHSGSYAEQYTDIHVEHATVTTSAVGEVTG
jgi:hypothetical protein